MDKGRPWRPFRGLALKRAQGGGDKSVIGTTLAWFAPAGLSCATTITPNAGVLAISPLTPTAADSGAPLGATVPPPVKVTAGENALKEPMPGIATPIPSVPK